MFCKHTLDAGFGGFLEVLKHVAWNSGWKTGNGKEQGEFRFLPSIEWSESIYDALPTCEGARWGVGRYC